MIFAFSPYHIKPPIVQDFLGLGAIFATTDSVAVLQVLDKDRSPILFSLVFGEGVINDAAGVALLRAIQVCYSQFPSVGIAMLCSTAKPAAHELIVTS